MDENDLLNEGITNFNKGEYLVSLSFFSSAIKMKPTCKEAYLNKGITLNILNKPSEAIESFKKSLELYPNYTSSLIGLGNSYLKLQNYQEALNYFNQEKEKPYVYMN